MFADDNMSSVESLASPDVTEKGTIDFGVKAVSLKTQDSNRLLQIRSLPSPARQTSNYTTQHPTVLASATQKPGKNIRLILQPNLYDFFFSEH